MKVAVFALAAFAACAFASGDELQPREEQAHNTAFLRVFPTSEEEHNFVRQFENTPSFDFASIRRNINDPIDVFVPFSHLDSFERELIANGVHYEVLINDVNDFIRQQYVENKNAQISEKSNDLLNHFPSYDEIASYLESISKSHSDIVELISFGKTYEGRNIVGVKIASNSSSKKPAMLIDAGIHAREWIAPTTVLYAIKQLVEEPSNRHVFQHLDIYVIPSINPDGYAYSHLAPTNRMWRKNRSPQSTSCFGTDINRNFGYDWRAERNPCSITFGGPTPFSELESQALKKFVLSKKDTLKVYLSFHSYGNYFLHPWGAKPELPKSAPKLECAATRAKTELAKIRGTQFTIGSSYNVLYAVYGGTKDWILGTAGVDLAYTIELPSKSYGFLAPPSEIIPVGRETFEAIKAFALYTEGKICQNV